MGTIINERKNGYSKMTCSGISSQGIIDFRYNGNTIPSSTTTVSITFDNIINIAINAGLLKKYQSICKAKLTIKKTTPSLGMLVLNKETSITSSERQILGKFIKNDDSYEIDLAKYLYQDDSEIMYFSINILGGIGSSEIYTQHSVYMPQIVFEYINEGQGLLGQKYISGSAGRALDFSINARSGQSFFTKQLISLGGNLMPINLGLVFSTHRKQSLWFEGMPYGWKTNYHQEIVSNTDGTKKYIDAQGLEHTFEKALNSNNIYFDISGTGLILTAKSDGTYTIDDGYKNYLDFNSNGYLEKIRKVIGLKTISTLIQYAPMSNKIYKITDGMGRVYTFTYNTSNIVISGPGVVDITLTINSNKLTKVTECGGRISNYTYSGYFLTQIVSDNGEKVVFTYDNLGRVKSANDYFINPVETLVNLRNIEYRVQTTVVTNKKGIKVQYSFDEDGELIGEYEVSPDGNGNFNTVIKSDFETVKNSVYKDSYYKYSSETIEREDSETEIPYKKKEGEISIEEGTEYIVVLSYKITNAYKDDETYQNYLLAYQDDEPIIAYPLDPTLEDEHVECFTLKATKNGRFTFKVLHNNEGRTKIYYIKVYKNREKIERVCLNKNTSSSPWLTNMIGITWGWIFDFLHFTYFDNSLSTTNSLTKKMLYEDLLENQKNHKLNPSSHHIWYNKKRGLIVNVKDVNVTIGLTNYELNAFNVAKIVVTNNYTTCNYRDYKLSTSDQAELMYEYNCISTDGKSGYSRTLYNSDFNVIKHLDFKGILSTLEYDVYGNVTKETYGSMVTSKTYTSDYKFPLSDIKYIGSKTSTTEYEFDGATGNLHKVTEPNLNEITYSYNPNTNELESISSSDGSVISKNKIYYAKDNITRVLSNETDGYKFTYDGYNLLSSVNTYKNGISYSFINFYNEIGNDTDIQEILYNNNFVEQFKYDLYGNLIEKNSGTAGEASTNEIEVYYGDIDVNSIASSYTPSSVELDKNSRSKIRKVVDNLTDNKQKYHYNDEGLLIKITNSSSDNVDRKEITYDSIDRIEEEKVTIGLRTSINSTYTYRDDDLSNLSDVSSIETMITHLYNTTQLNETYLKSNTKSALNLVTSDTLELGNYSHKRTFTYALKSSSFVQQTTPYVERVTYTNSYLSSQSSLGTITYTYDNMGNITKIVDTVTNNTISYTYDKLGRLIRENNSKLGVSKTWGYDKHGNITSRKEGTYTTGTFTPTTSYAYLYNTSYPDRLSSYNGNSVNYDVNGNIIQLGSYSFSWSRGRKLSSCTKAGMNYTFNYNGLGLRTRKYHGQSEYTDYIYDGNRLVSEHRVNGTEDYYINYVYTGDELVGFTYKNKHYYYAKNIQGDIIKLINNTNNVVATYVYDAWGNHKAYNSSGVESTSSTWIGNINPYRYRGYYYDVETGLFWLSSRYYSPELCRFISPDSVDYLDPSSINGLNLYSYCGNDPINYADPSGHSPEWWQWLINGATTALGIALCFVPGGQVFGAGLIVSGVSGLVANTMDAIGLDSELAMKIQSGLNVIGGIGLSFVPGLGALGASMIGAGVLSFAGGYISEALGGSYALGWGIGNVVGSIAGGMVYKGIVNKISTPSNMIKSFENHPNRWKLTGSEISDATGRSYRGGISNYSHYRNIWTRAQMGTHTITVNDIIKHFHYFF